MCGSPKALVCRRGAKASLVWRQKCSPAPRFPCAACPSAWCGVVLWPKLLPPPGHHRARGRAQCSAEGDCGAAPGAVCNQLLERPRERGEWQLLCRGDEAQLHPCCAWHARVLNWTMSPNCSGSAVSCYWTPLCCCKVGYWGGQCRPSHVAAWLSVPAASAAARGLDCTVWSKIHGMLCTQ